MATTISDIHGNIKDGYIHPSYTVESKKNSNYLDNLFDINSAKSRQTYLEKLLARKPIESYPDSVTKEMALVSLFPNGAEAFGSYIYRFK